MNSSSKPRRRLTDEQLRIWRDYIETAEQLRSELSRRLQQESALSTGDYAVLLALTEAENRRLRSSDLATAVGWERSRLSHHLGRMEKRGLIRREECAADTRGAEIVLVPAGFEAFPPSHRAAPGRRRRALYRRTLRGRARRGRHPHPRPPHPPRPRPPRPTHRVERFLPKTPCLPTVILSNAKNLSRWSHPTTTAPGDDKDTEC